MIPPTENSPAENTPSSDSPERKLTRRQMLRLLGGGAAGLAVAGTGGGFWWYHSVRRPENEAGQIRKAKIVIAGGGIGGLTVAARILRAVPDADVTVIEPSEEHHYQPGYTLVAAGVYDPRVVVWPQGSLIKPEMKWIKEAVAEFDPDNNRLRTDSGQWIGYDFLVVAMGVQMNPKSVEGFEEALSSEVAGNIYKLESGMKFRELVRGMKEGRALFTFPAGYVKCGGAPQKICWLSEDWWRRNGVRDGIEVVFATAQPSLFPVVPVIEKIVTPMMEARGIKNLYNCELKAVDTATRTAVFAKKTPDGGTEEQRMSFDLIHPMPKFQTPAALRQSVLTSEGLGGQLEVNRETLRHKRYANVFGVGDCCATGAPKTAATIRKQAPVVVENLLDAVVGREARHLYDGTSGCPLLTRYGRCMMFEFDFKGNLVHEWLYQSKRETWFWWEFKVHGLKRLYRDVMLNGLV